MLAVGEWHRIELLVHAPDAGSEYPWEFYIDDQLIFQRSGNVGWSAAEYLVPTLAPTGWAPPVASPTFEAEDAGNAGGDAGGSDVGGGAAIQPAASPIAVATTGP